MRLMKAKPDGGVYLLEANEDTGLQHAAREQCVSEIAGCLDSARI